MWKSKGQRRIVKEEIREWEERRKKNKENIQKYTRRNEENIKKIIKIIIEKITWKGQKRKEIAKRKR